MVALLLWLRGLPGDWLALGTWPRIGWLTVAVVGGATTYFGVLLLAGFRLTHLHGKSG
jgi:peptidoglycan biosynthesis protein MviN/MurJ (putative lipid II flippase)